MAPMCVLVVVYRSLTRPSILLSLLPGVQSTMLSSKADRWRTISISIRRLVCHVLTDSHSAALLLR